MNAHTYTPSLPIHPEHDAVIHDASSVVTRYRQGGQLTNAEIVALPYAMALYDTALALRDVWTEQLVSAEPARP